MKGAVKIIYLLLLIGYQQILAQKNENSKAKLLENTFPMYQKDSYKKVSLDEQYLTTQLYNNYARAAESDTLLISKQLDEVVVTAQFAPTSEKNVIYNIQVLNNQLIQKKAANNLRELLQQELNFGISQASVFGTSVEVGGISKENIKILIDGVPVIGRLNGIIDLNQINISNIDRVEIIKGPVSVFYGTDAMGGVINLITKKNQTKPIEGAIALYYESIKALNSDINISFKKAKNQFKIHGGNYHFFGMSTNEVARAKNWEERNQYFGGLQFIHDFGAIKMNYSGNIFNEILKAKGDIVTKGSTKTITDANYFTKRIDNSINLQGNINENKYFDFTASHLDYDRYHDTYKIDPTTQVASLSSTDTKVLNTEKYNYKGLKIQLGKNDEIAKINYAYGADISQEGAEGERVINKKKEIFTAAFFGSVNFKIGTQIELQPAARYLFNNAFGSLISPALNGKVKINTNNIIRFSYARGFRAPSLKELYLNFATPGPGGISYLISGNQALEVERGDNFSFTYTYRNDKLSLEPTLFYNNIKGLIALSVMANNKRNYINIDNFKSVGSSVEIKYKAHENLKLKAGFGYIGRYNKYLETFDNKQFMFSPEVTSSLNYFQKNIKTSFDIFYKYTGKLPGFYVAATTNTLVETTRNEFNNLDFTITKSIFSAGIKNIFNVTDIDTIEQAGTAHSTNTQLWGRSYFLKTKIIF